MQLSLSCLNPNDELTRANAKSVVDGFLSQLVIQRGPSHFVTVCDATNNTAVPIDRNELYIDIAIQPIKAVEFIYIPLEFKILWVQQHKLIRFNIKRGLFRPLFYCLIKTVVNNFGQ